MTISRARSGVNRLDRAAPSGRTPTTGARLLGAIGNDPGRFADACGLRAYAGAAPLTWASGTRKVVPHRRIANKFLMGTGHHWAFSSLTRSPGLPAHYDRRRAAGDNGALRHLDGRLMTCLHHCLITAERYTEHHASHPHHTARHTGDVGGRADQTPQEWSRPSSPHAGTVPARPPRHRQRTGPA